MPLTLTSHAFGFAWKIFAVIYAKLLAAMPEFSQSHDEIWFFLHRIKHLQFSFADMANRTKHIIPIMCEKIGLEMRVLGENNK